MNLRIYSIALLSFVLSGIFFSCENQDKEGADLIIYNANIWTGNENQPNAKLMAIKGDKIVAIGEEEIQSEWEGSNTETVDAQGHLITPGFIDSHVHFVTSGLNLSSVQLRDAKTPEEFKSRIKAFAESIPQGQWITGGDWDHENWGGELPTKEWIDEFTPENPVFIRRLDGHMSLANSLAMELAKIDGNTAEVEGGKIERDAQGNPTGLFRDNAMNLVFNIMPPPSEQEFEKGIQAAMNYVASQGVTSVHHVAGATPEGYLQALERARAKDQLITRIYAMLPLSEWPFLNKKIEAEGAGDEWLKLGGLKGFVDGSLGSHTAAFNAPYTDEPEDQGFFINPEDSLQQWIQAADAAGLQVTVHAIGDKAIHFILNTFEKVANENEERDRRFRIEHAQHIAPEDIPRFASLGVIPSMQPYHAIDDGRWAEKVIGPERIKTTYAFKSLFDNDARVAFGSDWFVAPPTVLEGIYAAVTRRTLDGANPEGWVPEQKISVEQALIAYTRNAAYASHDENIKGTLEVGKLADFVILEQDIFTIPKEEIWDTKVKATYVGGKQVYSADQ